MNSEIFQSREALHKAIYNCTLCKKNYPSVERVQPPWNPQKGKKIGYDQRRVLYQSQKDTGE